MKDLDTFYNGDVRMRGYKVLPGSVTYTLEGYDQVVSVTIYEGHKPVLQPNSTPKLDRKFLYSAHFFHGARSASEQLAGELFSNLD